MTEPAAGVSAPVRRLGASLLALGRIRLELLGIEVQEEKDRIAALLFWAVLMALMAGLGVVFVALFVTVALWETHRLAAIGAGALLFMLLAVYSGLRVRRMAGEGSRLFQFTIAELRKDAAALDPRPPA